MATWPEQENAISWEVTYKWNGDPRTEPASPPFDDERLKNGSFGNATPPSGSHWTVITEGYKAGIEGMGPTPDRSDGLAAQQAAISDVKVKVKVTVEVEDRSRCAAITSRARLEVPDTGGPKLKLARKKKQKSRKPILIKTTCRDEASTLKATGRIRVKFRKANGKVKTKKLKLKPAKASGSAGKRTKLKLRLKGRAKKLAKRAIGSEPSKARIRVRATDKSGNTTIKIRIVKVVKSSQGRGPAR